MENNLLFSSVWGAVIGDIVGSKFEFKPIKRKEFELFSGKGYSEDKSLPYAEYVQNSRFTDDTVMTIAICKALLECDGGYEDLSNLAISNMQQLGNKFPYSGYGYKFNQWLRTSNPLPYNSFGNGSAMRISGVPFVAKTLDELKILSKAVTEVTHNHEEGIKGAEAVASCIWLAKNGYKKEEIKRFVEENYYKLDFNYDELLCTYSFNETCQGSVPQAIYAFLISNSYEDTIRTAVSMGGDADTMADIAGAIAAEFYGIPYNIVSEAQKFLPQEFKDILKKFER